MALERGPRFRGPDSERVTDSAARMRRSRGGRALGDGSTTAAWPRPLPGSPFSAALKASRTLVTERCADRPRARSRRRTFGVIQNAPVPIEERASAPARRGGFVARSRWPPRRAHRHARRGVRRRQPAEPQGYAARDAHELCASRRRRRVVARFAREPLHTVVARLQHDTSAPPSPQTSEPGRRSAAASSPVPAPRRSALPAMRFGAHLQQGAA